MKKRIDNKGFTLTEVLVATALLAIFASMTIVGTSALFGTEEKMMTVSKAAVLGSDVMKVVTNELRFGENFALNASAGTITYNSSTYGDNCELKTDGEGVLLVVQTSTGVNASGELTTNSKTFYPIGSAAYDEVRVKAISFSIASGGKDRQVISCTVSVTSDGTNTLWEETVTIVPLYQKAVY